MYIVILLIILVLITKIEFRLINLTNDTDVYIKFGLLKIHIDYDMFVKNINKIRVKTNFNYNNLVKGIGLYNVIKNIINKSDVCINKFNIIKRSNNFNYFNIYFNTTLYTTYTFIKNFLIVNTKKQGNISFYVVPSTNNDIDVDIDIEFSLFNFLKSFLFNIKNIINLKKDMI